MMLLALITAPQVVQKILDHLRLLSTPPSLVPTCPTFKLLMFGDQLDQTDPFDAPESAASQPNRGAVAPRAPP